MYFSSFQLNARLLQALEKGGFSTPTPVQAKAIPLVMQGADVMACAQTGTGKTAAFVLPVLHRVLSGPSGVRGRGPRVLVLTPTRELAQQVADNVRTFSREAQVRAGVIVGGVGYGPQYNLLANPLDVLVATPGRLIDHMQEGKIDFTRVEVVVLDEADKMLDMGFLKPVERILEKINACAPRPQMLLFSATFTPSVAKFAQKVLRNPSKVELAPVRENHSQITQHVLRADGPEHKMALLETLLKSPDVTQAIVFSATKHGSEKLAKKLVAVGYASEALHGGMKQNARKRTLTKMHDGKLKVLVATDVAARGIDVKQLSHVINFDLPQVAEDYVHRIGRTGRAGESGVAISFVAPSDMPMLRDIEKMLGKKIELNQIDGMEPKMAIAEFEHQGALAPRTRKGQGGCQGGQGGQGGGQRASQGGFRGQPSRGAPGGGTSRPRRMGGGSRFGAR